MVLGRWIWEGEFTAQAQHFVRSAVFCAVRLGLAFRLEGGVFGVLDVAVTLGRFSWMGGCSERVEMIPNVWLT